MAYPSTLSSFTDPTVTNRLNAPSHSGIETAQNTDLKAIEAFMGVEGPASTMGTLIYDIRSPGSDGGGHIQGATKGGTGQTTYTKGDILAASSASVLSRLTAGSDGQIFSADSSKAAGVTWINNSTPKLFTSSSIIGMVNETSILNLSLAGSTLGTNNGIRTTVFMRDWDTSGTGGSVIARVQYGNQRLASILIGNNIAAGAAYGSFRHTMIASTTSLQMHILDFEGIATTDNSSKMSFTLASITGTLLRLSTTVTSSVESTATQTLGLTLASPQGTGGGNGVRISGVICEKIT